MMVLSEYGFHDGSQLWVWCGPGSGRGVVAGVVLRRSGGGSAGMGADLVGGVHDSDILFGIFLSSEA